MSDLSGKNFGLLIAYVVPGFVVLWGLQPVSLTIQSWLVASPAIPSGIEALFFVTVASIALGMTTSAFRWAIVDTLHAWTGLPRPVWDDAKLQQQLGAYDVIVEAHYRYYQFYANTLISLVAAAVIAWSTEQPWIQSPQYCAALLLTNGVFLAMSRDTLRKYYLRTSRLLGTLARKEERNGKRQPSQATIAAGKTSRRRQKIALVR